MIFLKTIYYRIQKFVKTGTGKNIGFPEHCALYPIWLFGCSHYLNLNSQTHEDIDILKMVSKAKFQKKLNGKIRSCHGSPNFV